MPCKSYTLLDGVYYRYFLIYRYTNNYHFESVNNE